MIVTIPPSLQQFCEKFRNILSKNQIKNLPMLFAGIILTRDKRTQSALGRSVKQSCRHRASISKFMRRVGFHTRDIFSHMCHECISYITARGKKKRTWVLCIDGTSTKRGGFSKIANAVQYKKKAKNKKGKSTKAHTFVMGLLITECGMRIPVPRRSYYTRRYCRKHKKKHKTQQELAVLMIESLKLPEDVALVVVADEYFEGEKLYNVCNRLGHTMIVPVDSRRCFADANGKSSGTGLHRRGKRIARDAFKKMVLVQGKENTVSYRRYSSKKSRSTCKRTYRVFQEIRDVTALGDTNIVYSWKSPVYRPRRDASKETFKVLICNNLRMSAREIVEWYDVRWQIELFFRELKSHLGMGDYCGTDFRAFERHVDLVLMSFLFLEWHRMELLEEKRVSPKQRVRLRTARTKSMSCFIEDEAERNDLEYITKAMRTKQGRRELLSLWPALVGAA